MTAEEASALTLVQRSLDRLTDKLDEHINSTADNFSEVKVDLAGLRGNFTGGWRAIAGVGAIATVIGGWLLALALRIVHTGNNP